LLLDCALIPFDYLRGDRSRKVAPTKQFDVKISDGCAMDWSDIERKITVAPFLREASFFGRGCSCAAGPYADPASAIETDWRIVGWLHYDDRHLASVDGPFLHHHGSKRQDVAIAAHVCEVAKHLIGYGQISTSSIISNPNEDYSGLLMVRHIIGKRTDSLPDITSVAHRLLPLYAVRFAAAQQFLKFLICHTV